METLPIIQVEQLSKKFGAVTAVEGLSFEINKGEIFGFLGPNGAGKTTSIRMILDLLRPDSGSIRLFGKSLSANSVEIRSKCGYLPGNFLAYGNLTGLEYLRLNSSLRGLHFNMDEDLIYRLGLDRKYLSRKIKALSHGTMQKLGIIQAFMHKPDLLIPDEPTIGLDPLMQEEFYILLKEAQADGSTIFLSSHNLSEVERICHRMAIIKDGKLVVTDKIENLRKTLNRKLHIVVSQEIGNIELPNAEMTGRDGLSFDFIIHDDIRPVLKKLAELPVTDVSIPEPGLEEIFIQYYKNKGHD